MRGLILILIALFFVRDVWSNNLELNRTPVPGECYPSRPGSKKYLKSVERPFYKRKVFTCDYVCLDAESNPHLVTGTSDLKDWFGESGKTFVCEGYRKTMKWVETPRNPNRWGHWEIDGVTPFHPMKRKLPELKQWYLDNFGLDSFQFFEFESAFILNTEIHD